MREIPAEWVSISDTKEERLKAIREGAMFFTWAAQSQTPQSNDGLEPKRYGDLPLDFDFESNPRRALKDIRDLCLNQLPKGCTFHITY